VVESLLESVLARHGLRKDAVMVESKNFAALAPLSASGFRTTYYLPWFDPTKLSPADLDARAAELVANARTARVHLISVHRDLLGLARDRMLPALPGVHMLTWFPRRHLGV
jgi:Lon protease-like protein